MALESSGCGGVVPRAGVRSLGHSTRLRSPAAALLLLLTACASDPQVIYQRIYVKQEIPASLLECAPWPQPDTLPQDVRGLVEWLARAKAAHVDCSYKLGQVRGLVSP